MAQCVVWPHPRAGDNQVPGSLQHAQQQPQINPHVSAQLAPLHEMIHGAFLQAVMVLNSGNYSEEDIYVGHECQPLLAQRTPRTGVHGAHRVCTGKPSHTRKLDLKYESYWHENLDSTDCLSVFCFLL